jgi:hypothetical protein
MFGIPTVSLASKSSPWATSEAPIDSQTPTECSEIPFSQNELVAPEKKPNQKFEKEKKCRNAFLRSSQVRKLLNAGGKPSTKFPPDRLDEKARIQASSLQEISIRKTSDKPSTKLPLGRLVSLSEQISRCFCRDMPLPRGLARDTLTRRQLVSGAPHKSEARSHMLHCTSGACARC